MRHFVVASMREEGRCWISKVIGGKHSTSEPSHRCHENAFVNSLATVEGRWITAISRAWILASSLTSGGQNSPQSAFVLNSSIFHVHFAFITAFGAKTLILNGCLKRSKFLVFKCPVLFYLSNRPHRVDSQRGSDPLVKESVWVG